MAWVLLLLLLLVETGATAAAAAHDPNARSHSAEIRIGYAADSISSTH
eukprot:COSAG06_NODE_25420_length_637_cov_1.234201_2_plen_47_part_01